jgi:hypothetical protein
MLKTESFVIEYEVISISNEQWNLIFKRFGSLPFNYYSDVDDTTEIETPSTSLGDVAMIWLIFTEI